MASKHLPFSLIGTFEVVNSVNMCDVKHEWITIIFNPLNHHFIQENWLKQITSEIMLRQQYTTTEAPEVRNF